jgi:hypothetical protein
MYMLDSISATLMLPKLCERVQHRAAHTAIRNFQRAVAAVQQLTPAAAAPVAYADIRLALLAPVAEHAASAAKVSPAKASPAKASPRRGRLSNVSKPGVPAGRRHAYLVACLLACLLACITYISSAACSGCSSVRL